MRAWREPATCGECEELRLVAVVGLLGERVEWHECAQDGSKARREGEACPLFTRRVERPSGRT